MLLEANQIKRFPAEKRANKSCLKFSLSHHVLPAVLTVGCWWSHPVLSPARWEREQHSGNWVTDNTETRLPLCARIIKALLCSTYWLKREYCDDPLSGVGYISLLTSTDHISSCPLVWYTSLPQPYMFNMVYSSASSIDMLQPMAGTSGVQNPKRHRKYVPHHMRSAESALKRNARERRRQGRINDALDRLNLHLPQTTTGSRKPGKEDIIRMAIEHIRNLSSILGETSRKRSSFTVHGNLDEIPEPSPEFQNLPAELFGQLMIEAQHWISSTHVTPLMTPSPNNVRIPAKDPLHGEYIISDPSTYTIQEANVHCQSPGEESGYFDGSYVDVDSPCSSLGSSVADDIVDELFTSDSFTSDISNELLESRMDFDTCVWWWYTLAIILLAIVIENDRYHGPRVHYISLPFHQFVCVEFAWLYISTYHHYHYFVCFPSHIYYVLDSSQTIGAILNKNINFKTFSVYVCVLLLDMVAMGKKIFPPYGCDATNPAKWETSGVPTPYTLRRVNADKMH